MKMGNSNPLVSIIILNYNQLDTTCEFLESTRALTYPNYEIIVVDNDSKIDPTERIVAGNYTNTKVLLAGSNLGFTGGNNFGIKEAKGDFLFIVNNDTEVTPDLLERLLEPFYQDEKIGMVSPKIRYFSNPEIIQYAGYTKMNPVTGRNNAIGSREVDKGQYNVSGYTPYAHGAAMMVKREVIEKVGMLPEVFFIYYEELDWSSQIRRAGYEIFYQASALIFHKESITMGKESAIKAYFHTRNRILFMRRNSNNGQLALFLLFLFFFIIPKSLFKYTIKFQTKHLRSFVRGLVWNLQTPRFS